MRENAGRVHRRLWDGLCRETSAFLCPLKPCYYSGKFSMAVPLRGGYLSKTEWKTGSRRFALFLTQSPGKRKENPDLTPATIDPGHWYFYKNSWEPRKHTPWTYIFFVVFSAAQSQRLMFSLCILFFLGAFKTHPFCPFSVSENTAKSNGSSQFLQSAIDLHWRHCVIRFPLETLVGPKIVTH